MTESEKRSADRAGRIVKILKLRLSYPSDIMDEVAVKLNSGLTYEEERQAKMWAIAFRLAEGEGSVFDLAEKLLGEMR